MLCLQLSETRSSKMMNKNKHSVGKDRNCADAGEVLQNELYSKTFSNSDKYGLK